MTTRTANAPRIRVLRGERSPVQRVHAPALEEKRNRIRVAAYCRVSTDHEDQETSFEAQQTHFTNLISGNPGWELAGRLGALLERRGAEIFDKPAFGSVALARRLVPPARRSAAAVVVFALLACNLYHLYFNTIPKTYALGGLFLMAGLLLIVRGLEAGGTKGGACLFTGGLSLAFATGTRISLLLILPVVGVTLLVRFRTFKWSFAWYGFGGATGLLLTYGVFTLDADSLRGLLAAQSYHAARGGFDPFFVIGSVSRLVRGYLALGAAFFAAVCLCARGEASCEEEPERGREVARTMFWILGLGFAAVFALQLSAPFPYDDYQVPIMGMLTVLVAAWLVRRLPDGDAWRVGAAWFVVLTASAISFASPLLQEWAAYSNDRFWSQKKEMTELAKLRAVGRKIEALDPGGDTLLTQDLYLAVERRARPARDEPLAHGAAARIRPVSRRRM